MRPARRWSRAWCRHARGRNRSSAPADRKKSRKRSYSSAARAGSGGAVKPRSRHSAVDRRGVHERLPRVLDEHEPETADLGERRGTDRSHIQLSATL